mgnify:CR=1 FL=1
MATLAQVRRAHIRQQLTEEEQIEFDEHYGEEDDLMYEEEEEEESQQSEELDEEDQDHRHVAEMPNEDEMDFYMQ